MAYGRKTGGRAKGTPNTTTRTVREQLTQAFELLQQDKTANLLSWAKSNPTEFYKLAAKLIPIQLHTETEQPQTIIQIVPDYDCHPLK
ncbi:MAG: hypothetical protein IM564_01985 [Chitinophagaceae bacterium]|nr:hypothetical protein [Chitinophagaceae bacterium]